MPLEHIIEVSGLHKSYGSVHAVKGLDFYVEAGKIFAFLGPNGAGKSTTIDIICTFLKPDSGSVTVDGHVLGQEDNAIRSSIGAVFQDSLLDNLLTVEENLKTRGSFYGLKGRRLDAAAKKAAEITGVTELLKRPYGKLSGGQRRRCDISRALVHTPNILFLDEPTTGLDPQTRKVVWETITALQKETGMTVFMTTHYMEEAASAHKVAIIDKGRIAAQGTPEELRLKYSSDYLKIQPKNIGGLKEQLDAMGVKYEEDRGLITVKCGSSMEALELLKKIENHVFQFEVVRGSMDDVFMALTGHTIREGGVS
jgi:multidrug/hemolysin transport system ATP-binding protein